MTDLQSAFRNSLVCRRLARALLREGGEPKPDQDTITLVADIISEWDDLKILEIINAMEPVYPKQCRKLYNLPVTRSGSAQDQ